MRFYIINLDRAPERWAYMSDMCRRQSMTAERVVAVDGRELSAKDIDALAPPSGDRRRLSANEVACFESHKRAWRKIAEGPDSFGGVLEDDVFLVPEFARTCDAILAVVPDADLIKLNNYERPVYVFASPAACVNGIALHRLAQRTIDASAYLMSRSAAQRALATFGTYARELDVELFDPAKGLVALQVVPAVSVQEKFATFRFLPEAGAQSAIEESRYAEIVTRKNVRPRKSIWQKIIAEYGRFWRRRIEPKIFWWSNLKKPPDQRIIQLSVHFTNI